jgi:dipeptidyl aminopeptidase/acylaminoacyl peptidase
MASPTTRTIVAAALCLAVAVAETAAATPPILIERQAVSPPAWADAQDAHRATTETAYAAAASDPRYQLERVRYRSDGLEVSAYLYRPRASAGPQPLVVFNRGSFVRPGLPTEMLPIAHRFAEAGFVTIAPLYRGSDGSAGTDEMGGGDLADLMRIVDLARELPGVDATRLFLYGESRGGMMALQAVRDGFPAKAAATYGTFTDLAFFLDANPERNKPLIAAIWPNFASQREAILERRSATRWADRLAVPLLLMHGGADGTVSPRHALRLATALEDAGRPYQLIIFAGDGHVLAQHEEERERQAIAWFRAHLAP